MSHIFRPMLLTSSLARNGTTTAFAYPQIWPGSTSFCLLSGWTESGDLTLTSRMPSRSPSKPWPYQTIMSGCTGLRRYSTWSSKHNCQCPRTHLATSCFRLTLLLSCSMKFSLYPFDEQNCHLSMESCKYIHQ